MGGSMAFYASGKPCYTCLKRLDSIPVLRTGKNGDQLTNKFIILMAVSAMLSSCMTAKEPAEPVVLSEESMVFLEPGLRPEVLLFPDYLLMEDFELNQHGIIPESDLVGAGMRTILDLKIAMRRFNDALDAHGWKTEKTELGNKSFRTLASTADEFIEIRAVQGNEITQVFILFRPKPIADTIKNY